MAIIAAKNNGIWSNALNWTTNSLPTSVDDVFSNNKIVTIDTNITVNSLSSQASSGITAGGYFQLIDANSNTVVVTVGTIYGGGVASGTIVSSLTGNNYANVVSTNGQLITGSSQVGIRLNGTGILNYYGEVGHPDDGGGNASNPIQINASCKLNVYGNVHATTSSGSGISISAAYTPVINVYGSVYGSGTSPTTAAAIWAGTSAPSPIINITGDVIAFGNPGIYATGAATVNASGSIIGSAAAAAIYSASYSSSITIRGPIINYSGYMAIQAVRIFLSNTMPTYWNMVGQDLANNRNLYTADYIPTNPAVANVRLGVVYANSSLTGTCNIPPANSVQSGVPVDNTVGTATITAAEIWNYPIANATISGSMGERLRDCATVESTGQQLNFLL